MFILMFSLLWLLDSSWAVKDTMIERREIKVNGFAFLPRERGRKGITLFRDNQQQDEPNEHFPQVECKSPKTGKSNYYSQKKAGAAFWACVITDLIE